MTPDTKQRKKIFVANLYTLRLNAPKSSKPNDDDAQDANSTSSESEQNQKQPWFKNYGIVTTRYLQQVHHINTISGLAKKLNIANSRHPSDEKALNLSFQTIDAIIDSCEKWRKYLADQESFELLVCLEVISMAKIHASVISERNFSKRQGASGVRLNCDAYIPRLFTTVVSYHGSLQIFS